MGVKAVRFESRGSIFRDFAEGKSSIAFVASILIHFIHISAVYFSGSLLILDGWDYLM
jgi:hypothetical protein